MAVADGTFRRLADRGAFRGALGAVPTLYAECRPYLCCGPGVPCGRPRRQARSAQDATAAAAAGLAAWICLAAR